MLASNIPSTSTQPFIPPLPAIEQEEVRFEPATIDSTHAAPPAVPSVSPGNIANLLSTLLKAGVVSTNGTPIGAGATVKEQASSEEITEDAVSAQVRDAVIRVHRDAILVESVNFQTLESVS